MKKLIILALCLVALLSCAIAETEAQIANEPVRGDLLEATDYLNVRSEPCTSGTIITTLAPGTRVTYNGESKTNCGYTWYSISGSFKNGWAAKDWLRKVPKGQVNYNVPMVHQRWDTGDSFNGDWACGPTSAVMVVSFFGKLAKKPIHNSKPSPHYNDYGWYVANRYTSNTGFDFSRSQNDPSGRPAQGAYGHCMENGLAWAWRIQSYCEKHGLKTQFHSTATLSGIQQALNNKRIVILSTDLFGGHIIVVKGYGSGQTVIVNDPWGDYTKPNYGHALNGGNAFYTFNNIKPKWMVTVWQ